MTTATTIPDSRHLPLIKRPAVQPPPVYVIPLNLAARKRRLPWKPGEASAVARGISDRKHRETRDALWRAERQQLTSPQAYQRARRKYVQPRQHKFYRWAMLDIQKHHEKGEPMRAVSHTVLAGDVGSLDEYAERYPDCHYVLQFIADELKEKSWPGAALQYETVDAPGNGDAKANITLCCDFTQQ